MDNNPNPETGGTPEQDVCINCGSPEILEGYRNNLCAPCRQKFIKFPIPLWVKLFGAGIVVIMLVSMIWLPGNIRAAILLSRAERAEDNHDYITEQRQLEEAKKLVPGAIDIQAHLAIAAFYNEDFQVVVASANSLEHKSFDDTVLFNKVDYVMNQTKEYFPSDTFTNVLGKYKKSVIPDTAYQRYLNKFPMDIFAIYSLASSYADEEKYIPADSLLTRALNIDAAFIPALNLKTMVKRELKQPDSSIYYCDKILRINHQSAFALSSKARTLLKIGKNKEGLQLARQCYAVDSKMPYNVATLAIAYHLNSDFKHRDELIKAAEKDSASALYMKFAKDIISNKVKFQN